MYEWVVPILYIVYPRRFVFAIWFPCKLKHVYWRSEGEINNNLFAEITCIITESVAKYSAKTFDLAAIDIY